MKWPHGVKLHFGRSLLLITQNNIIVGFVSLIWNEHANPSVGDCKANKNKQNDVKLDCKDTDLIKP